MKLSSRSRYAVNAMVELATTDTESETPIVRMAQSYGLSQSSMEQLFARLRRAGLVNGRRGRRGGYRLARPADQITLAEVVGSVDDDYIARMTGKGASKAPKKVANPVWECISQKLYSYLEEITLAQVIEYAQSEKGPKDEWCAPPTLGSARRRKRGTQTGSADVAGL